MLYRLWQKNVGEIPEQEVMTELLTALRKVKGFEERAKELSESYGELVSVQGSTIFNCL